MLLHCRDAWISWMAWTTIHIDTYVVQQWILDDTGGIGQSMSLMQAAKHVKSILEMEHEVIQKLCWSKFWLKATARWIVQNTLRNIVETISSHIHPFNHVLAQNCLLGSHTVSSVGVSVMLMLDFKGEKSGWFPCQPADSTRWQRLQSWPS